MLNDNGLTPEQVSAQIANLYFDTALATVGKNVPGEVTPLHREMDTTKQDANNRVAKANCDDIWGGYDGQVMNCDEYPFKATQEGAASSNGHYSSRLIGRNDNQAAGNAMLQHFGFDRVHNGEAFYVNTRP